MREIRQSREREFTLGKREQTGRSDKKRSDRERDQRKIIQRIRQREIR